MIFVRASGYDHDALEKAFREFAEFHGYDRAVEALERSTGARDVASVPEHRIINALAELVCGFSFVGKSESKPQNNVVRLHEALASIREGAFARMRENARR